MLKKYTFVFLLFLLGLFILSACGKKQAEKNNVKKNEKTEAKQESKEASTENGIELDGVTLDGATEEFVSAMSLEEKVGQLFFVSTDSLDVNSQKKISDSMRENMDLFHPGGIIFFSYNLKDRQQTTEFIQNLQFTSRIPLFIGCDEEGGSVQRLARVKEMHMDLLPSMYQIGQTCDSSNAYQLGIKIAENMTALGFNLDFAPVADVCKKEENTEIGDRSFGDDPDLVAEMVSEEVKGLQENNICATLKHFPGQGAVKEDTHKGYANLETTIDVLRKNEFKPFEQGIQSGVDLVMMSHISVNTITQNEVPASLSKLMVKDILRDELEFDGIIITDAMNMKVITKFYSSSEAAIAAIKAGVDMILIPDDYEEAYEAVLEAVNEGEISEKRIDDSVERIIRTKIKRNIIPIESIMIH